MRLTVETGPSAGTQVSLDRNHPVTLGSGADCTVRIVEAGVAAEHAVVKALRDSGYGVKALAPGLRVNGREIEAAQLHDGDVLELGTTRVVYGQPAAAKGPQLKGFKILGELGKGGMGIVYRAEQVSLHRQVALKVLDKRFTDDAQFVAKFVAEARSAAKLSHPNVVHVFDVDQEAGIYYYAMELMHHGSLEAWLKKHGRMPAERALQVVLDAASGLAYAESLGIVHRDIKPDNLMLDQHGTVKIADLGLAFTEEDPEEKVAGTPHFMAPEQALRKGVDHRTDLYALGCTFYRLVTGRTPFRGQTVKDILRAHVRDQAEPANKVEPSVPAPVAAIIQRLMAKEPGDRYQSANELIEAVQEQLQPPARKGLWIGLAAAGVLIAGGAVYWAVTKPKEVVEVEKKYDDPEKQLFADQLRELRGLHKEDLATIAFLRARLDGGAGAPLATALDAVVAAHPDTKAAAEARQLAEHVRGELASAEAARQRAAQATEQALAGLRTQVEGAVGQGDLPRALNVVTGAPQPEGVDADAFRAGVQELRQGVLDRATAKIRGLEQEIDAARGKGDAAAVQAASAGLAQIVRSGGWPDALVGDRAALQQRVTAAEAAARDLVASQQQDAWREFSQFAHGPGGIDADLARADFAAAAARLQQYAEQAGADPVADHARGLAGALAAAQQFGDALLLAIGNDELQVPVDGANLQVAKWQRAEGQLGLVDPAKKPAKETAFAAADLTIDQWHNLAQQVAEPEGAAGSRCAFVALVALERHARAARAYLGALRAGEDDSGTGTAGYPLSFSYLEQAQQRLPAEAVWAPDLRSELAAAQLLAQGLRALSERRNLAAASYLEHLVADHGTSLCVTALP